MCKAKQEYHQKGVRPSRHYFNKSRCSENSQNQLPYFKVMTFF